MENIDIRKGATKKIRLEVRYNGEILDLSSDTVSFFLKDNETDLDSAALIDQGADVSSQGSKGIALITLSESTTAALTIGKKFYEILLERSNGEEYVLRSSSLWVFGRISDVT